MDSTVPLLAAVNLIASEYHWSAMSLLEQYLRKVRTILFMSKYRKGRTKVD